VARRRDAAEPSFLLWRRSARIFGVRIVGFIWIEEILEKLLRKHNVREDEVVEIFENSPMFRFVENGHREDERVYSARLERTLAEQLRLAADAQRSCRGPTPAKPGHRI
jgi:energy-converting hydrogenase A subunit M